MIEDVEINGNIFYAKVSNMITKEDVESVIPKVEEIINKHGKIKCLIFLNEVKGYTIDGFLADFGFYFKNKNAFNTMAIVGDKAFEKAMTELMDKFLPGKAKYFDSSKLAEAKDWINKTA